MALPGAAYELPVGPHDEWMLLYGGCCIDEDNPRWVCLDCEHRWGKRGE